MDAYEQYLLELINRARLDPEAEAARHNIDLNYNNTGATITGEARQVLAQNDLLSLSAHNHSLHMQQTSQFDHSGIGDGTPTSRALDAGFDLGFSTGVGENISRRGTTGTIDPLATMESHHSGLFISIGHRLNILNDSYDEIGLGRVIGPYTTSRTWNGSHLTEVFGLANNNAFYVTGVVYNDTTDDDFYTVGEGLGSIGISAGGYTGTSSTTGGYSIGVPTTTSVGSTFDVASSGMTVTLIRTGENIKVDFVNGAEVYTSASVAGISGVSVAGLLGIADLSLTGGGVGETLIGNRGDNAISGEGGNDVLRGAGGADQLNGGAGWDAADYEGSASGVQVNLFYGVGRYGDAHGDTYALIESAFGSAHNDILRGTNGANILDGRSGNDFIIADAGNDILRGGSGNDILRGGAGADQLIGGSGFDVADYSNSAARVLVNLFYGNALQGDAQGDTLTEMESAFGSAFNDVIRGSTGNNAIRGNGGDDILIGDGGADLFQYADTNWGNDLIEDFTDGVDRLDLRGSGLSYGDLTIAASGGDTFVSITGVTGSAIQLDSFTGTLDANDFIF